MDKRIIMSLVVVALLLGACGTESSAPVAERSSALPEAGSTVVEEPSAAVEEGEAPELVPTDCLNGEVSPIGQSIADDYETVSYGQVVTWFCNGAEYEDILVALETEALTDTTAEETLKMLADGFTWEEIWQLVGLTD